MTMRTKTLTAVAALSIFAGSYALAQEGATTAPAETEVPAETEATTPPAAEPAAESAAADEQATEANSQEPVVNEVPAETDAEAPAADAAAEETAESAAEVDEAPVEEIAPAAGEETAPADDGAAEEAAGESPAAEVAPTEEAEAASADDAAAQPATEEAASGETGAEETPEAAANESDAAPAEAAAPADADADEAHAEEGEEGGGHGAAHIEDIDFSFEGPFGKFDQFQLQRGLQVYTEVCAACHGMKFVPIRTLHDEGGPGLPEDQVRAYAQNMTIIDKETGEERPREPTDHFPTVSGEGMGPDLSLMAKARAGFHGPVGTGLSQLVNGIGGPEYIHAVLTGYTGEEKTEAGTTLYENTAFETGFISMPPPLSEGLVTYEDGTEATVDQMARDVSAFLMWTAEPKMMARKQVGLVSVLFLIILTGLLYMTNKKLWAPHKGKKN